MRTVAALVLAALAGCGGHYRVVAPTVDRPVSATAWVFDDGGALRRTPDDLDVLLHFKHEVQRWSLLWGLVGLGPDRIDVSAPLQSLLDANRCDAIVNLDATVSESDVGFNMLAFLPLLPSRVTTILEGDVVRMRGHAP